MGSAWHRQEEAQQEIKTVSIRNLLIPATPERVNWWILQLFILQFPPAWFSYISPPADNVKTIYQDVILAHTAPDAWKPDAPVGNSLKTFYRGESRL